MLHLLFPKHFFHNLQDRLKFLVIALPIFQKDSNILRLTKAGLFQDENFSIVRFCLVIRQTQHPFPYPNQEGSKMFPMNYIYTIETAVILSTLNTSGTEIEFIRDLIYETAQAFR